MSITATTNATHLMGQYEIGIKKDNQQEFNPSTERYTISPTSKPSSVSNWGGVLTAAVAMTLLGAGLYLGVTKANVTSKSELLALLHGETAFTRAHLAGTSFVILAVLLIFRSGVVLCNRLLNNMRSNTTDPSYPPVIPNRTRRSRSMHQKTANFFMS